MPSVTQIVIGLKPTKKLAKALKILYSSYSQSWTESFYGCSLKAYKPIKKWIVAYKCSMM